MFELFHGYVYKGSRVRKRFAELTGCAGEGIRSSFAGALV